MRSTLSEFKNFISRGNVVDLAIAVVLGVAFAAVVTALVADILTPIIAVIFGSHDFSLLTFSINGSVFKYGAFINALITFVSVAAAIFFFVVKPLNALAARRAAGQPDPEADTRACTECLSEIPKAARRCAFCTAEQQPMSDPVAPASA
ncbi:MAG TPA: large conductance mechanosensitive channel protein MscL [Solirubrobacteraceae bacterium]|jgi:large conductance mechanosensitive channel|nr:large conductance mechanosensitive channel protein MscL [Solirubrobacteraceae bacterium]